jgi:hypothetical protein
MKPTITYMMSCEGCGVDFETQPVPEGTLPAEVRYCRECEEFESVMQVWSHPRGWERHPVVGSPFLRGLFIGLVIVSPFWLLVYRWMIR